MSQSAVVTAFQCQLVSPKGTQEGEKYLWSTTHQTAATSYNEPQGSSGCGKHNILAPDRWGTYERNDFSKPRLLHLPIHREVLNFLIGNAWFSFSLVQFTHSVVSNSLRPHGLQHARPPCPSLTPGVYSNSCPLSRWWHPTISSSVVRFSSCLQSFPASGSFPMSQLLPSGDQSIGASASSLTMNIQGWFPLGLTGLILQSKEHSRAFFSTAIWKPQFFGTQPSFICLNQIFETMPLPLSFLLVNLVSFIIKMYPESFHSSLLPLKPS